MGPLFTKARGKGGVRAVGDENPEVTARLEALDARINALTDRPGHWEPEAMASIGTMITLSVDGTVVVERGLVRPEDAQEGVERSRDADFGAEEAETAPPALSATLVADLTAQRTAALRVALATSRRLPSPR